MPAEEAGTAIAAAGSAPVLEALEVRAAPEDHLEEAPVREVRAARLEEAPAVLEGRLEEVSVVREGLVVPEADPAGEVPAVPAAPCNAGRCRLMEDFGRVPLCNHRPDRGIYIRGFCLPLCARCTGILTGAVGGTIAAVLTQWRFPILLGIALILPTAVDGVMEYRAGRESNNTRRLVTGLLAGIGCVVVERAVMTVLFGAG